MNRGKTRSDLDKEITAFHEAGHAVVAWLLGCDRIRVAVWPNPDGDENDAKYWLGNCSHSETGTGSQKHGLAGLAAEIIRENPDSDGYELQEFIDCGIIEPSETDRAAMDGYTIDDCQNVVAMLRANWAVVTDLANLLQSDEILTDHLFSEFIQGYKVLPWLEA
tara:strand:- start:5196 stop:5687 length:492 start_codon:yes stop_codon:yes gene_type:complete